MQTNHIESIHSILEKIEYISDNIRLRGDIYAALSDETTTRPAILMLLTGIAEQLTKLQEKGAKDILSFFEEEELKGMKDIRNFIAHDYDGVDLVIVEWVLRHALPLLEEKCQRIVSEI